MKFELGRLVATAGVYERTQMNPDFGEFVSDCLKRYVACDWGDLCSDDANQNDEAVKNGEDRILVSYPHTANSDWKIWIITEWDRSVTTILFPSEY